MEEERTITFTIPINNKSIGFIRSALGQASNEGFDVAPYMKQLEKAEVDINIELKKQELKDLEEEKSRIEKEEKKEVK